MTAVVLGLTADRPAVRGVEQPPRGELVIGPRRFVEQRRSSEPFLGAGRS